MLLVVLVVLLFASLAPATEAGAGGDSALKEMATYAINTYRPALRRAYPSPSNTSYTGSPYHKWGLSTPVIIADSFRSALGPGSISSRYALTHDEVRERCINDLRLPL